MFIWRFYTFCLFVLVVWTSVQTTPTATLFPTGPLLVLRSVADQDPTSREIKIILILYCERTGSGTGSKTGSGPT